MPQREKGKLSPSATRIAERLIEKLPKRTRPPKKCYLLVEQEGSSLSALSAGGAEGSTRWFEISPDSIISILLPDLCDDGSDDDDDAPRMVLRIGSKKKPNVIPNDLKAKLRADRLAYQQLNAGRTRSGKPKA